MKFFIILSCCLVAAFATEVEQCKTGTLPKAVRVEGCDKPPCLLVRGTNAKLEVDFKTETETKSLAPKVFATAVGVTLPYQLPGALADACKYLADGKQCPLKAHEEFSYHLEMPVEKSYPAVPVNLQFSLLDDKEKPVFCFEVKCTVV